MCDTYGPDVTEVQENIALALTWYIGRIYPLDVSTVARAAMR